MLTCRECGLENHAGTVTCPNCGVNYPVGSTVLVDMLQENELPFLTAISLQIRLPYGLQALSLPDSQHFTLGRYEFGISVVPDLDLSAFGALGLGVSRIHAAIDRTFSTVTLTDLDSQNGTDLNGRRLQPHQARSLRHNDVICLGKMILYVHL